MPHWFNSGLKRLLFLALEDELHPRLKIRIQQLLSKTCSLIENTISTHASISASGNGGARIIKMIRAVFIDFWAPPCTQCSDKVLHVKLNLILLIKTMNLVQPEIHPIPRGRCMEGPRFKSQNFWTPEPNSECLQSPRQ